MASRKESCTRFKKQKLIIYRFPPKVNRNMARAIAERRTTLSLIQFTRKMFCMENGTNQNTDMAKKKNGKGCLSGEEEFIFVQNYNLFL